MISNTSLNTWFRSGIKPGCIFGGMLSAAAVGAFAGAYFSKILENEAKNSKYLGSGDHSFFITALFKFFKPIIATYSAIAMLPLGAIVGNNIANQILNRDLFLRR